MKTTFKLSLVVLLMLGAFSCKKDGNSSSNSSVTTDQVADIAAGSLAANSEGFASVTDDIAVNAQGISSTSKVNINSTGGLTTSSVHQECGTTRTDSVTRSLTIDSVTLNYFFKYSHTLNCNTSNQPDNVANALTFHGSFDGPRLSSNDSGSATFTIAGLTENATNFVVNGEYKRDGSFQSKVGDKASGNSHVDLTVVNVKLSKPGRKIVSGTGTLSVTGTGPKGANFSYTGTIVFNGDGTATLTISGTVYTVNLASGHCLKHK